MEFKITKTRKQALYGVFTVVVNRKQFLTAIPCGYVVWYSSQSTDSLVYF
jgi:hypothetical protein